LAGDSSVENKVLMSVVFPRPDSPTKGVHSGPHRLKKNHIPTTMMVKWAPRFATILCLCNGLTRQYFFQRCVQDTDLVGKVGNANTINGGCRSGHCGRGEWTATTTLTSKKIKFPLRNGLRTNPVCIYLPRGFSGSCPPLRSTVL